MPEDDKAALVRQAVVAAAIKAAEVGQPFTQQRNPPGWVLTEVGKACGCSVSGREVKDHLQRAVHDGQLIYRRGYGKVHAGYFPPDRTPPPLATRGEPGGEKAGPVMVETGVETEVEAWLKPG